MPPRYPLLIVVSAPSGAGKTTLCDRLLNERTDIVYSISCTTRKPRGREVHGRDYFFLSDEEFQDRIRRGEFLEHAQVHDFRYGTLRSTVLDSLRAGQSVLLDIDVQGTAQIRDRIRGAASDDPIRAAFLDIFIEPPSLDELRKRIVGRNENTEEEIRRRLRNAEEEMRHAPLYAYRIINCDLDAAFRKLSAVIESEQTLRSARQ